MRYTLADFHFASLLPLTFSRPISELRVGMDRIIDKWQRHFGEKPGIYTASHLHKLYPVTASTEGIVINASLIPDSELVGRISNLPKGHLLAWRGKPLAMHCDAQQAAAIYDKVAHMAYPDLNAMAESREVYAGDVSYIGRPSDLFAENAKVLAADYIALTGGRRTLDFPKGVVVIGDRVHVEEDAILRPCILNSEEGPIYIAKGAEVMEGCMVRGPLYLGAHSALKMGTKIYGATTIGAHCRVGGEVNNSLLDDYANKGHDGFLGNSVIGSWCNLGADTNTSNLKNNYGQVRVWNYATESMDETGLQFHGLIMGDHSKAGINTMFNTGTVVGMCANVYGGGFPPKFIPSFSWGNSEGMIDFDLDRAFDMAQAMMERRNTVFGPEDKALFKAVFEMDRRWRR